jgi:hypothetical protein
MKRAKTPTIKRNPAVVLWAADRLLPSYVKPERPTPIHGATTVDDYADHGP